MLALLRAQNSISQPLNRQQLYQANSIVKIVQPRSWIDWGLDFNTASLLLHSKTQYYSEALKTALKAKSNYTHSNKQDKYINAWAFWNGTIMAFLLYYKLMMRLTGIHNQNEFVEFHWVTTLYLTKPHRQCRCTKNNNDFVTISTRNAKYKWFTV